MSSPLRGCVNDANRMAEYLTEDLGVSEDHIQRLLSTSSPPHVLHSSNGTLISTISDGVQRLLNWSGMTNSPIMDSEAKITNSECIEPTRANIINSLLRLSTDTRIEEGDNILIYFSGHGSKYFCSEYTPYGAAISGTGAIEALCPIDRNDINGSTVPDISDREINTILSEISRTKGHNITFILDCCHSSGLTRAVQGKEGVRAIMPLPSGSIQDMFNAADKNLGDLPGYESVSRADWDPNMDSHVVLAACKEYEFAREVKGKGGYSGVFTQALISALKSADYKSMDYIGLLQALPRNTDQTPVVAGTHKDAKLWYQV